MDEQDHQQASLTEPGGKRENWMTIALSPLIALIAGILILVMPRLLNYIVAFYLIIIGLVGLFGGGANFTL